MQRSLIVAVLFGVGVASVACRPPAASPHSPAPTVAGESWAWEADIARFEAADRIAPPSAGGVVFVGSSSIRLWPALATDFPGLGVVQRGFGGSELRDVVRAAPRIVLPYRPRFIVLYAGENDLNNGRSPEAVFADYVAFVELVWRTLPQTRIAFVSIKPSPSRWALVEKMRATNEMVRQYAASHPGLAYVDVFTPMLGPDGLPRAELFVEDKLHLSAEGYALWRRLLAPVLPAPRN